MNIKTKPPHSPLPWKLFSLSHGDFKKELYIAESNQQSTPVLALSDMDVNSKAYRDAAFIVQSVNRAPLFEELIKAASAVMKDLEEYGPSIVPHLMDTDENAGQRLRDLIARAEAVK